MKFGDQGKVVKALGILGVFYAGSIVIPEVKALRRAEKDSELFDEKQKWINEARSKSISFPNKPGNGFTVDDCRNFGKHRVIPNLSKGDLIRAQNPDRGIDFTTRAPSEKVDVNTFFAIKMTGCLDAATCQKDLENCVRSASEHLPENPNLGFPRK